MADRSFYTRRYALLGALFGVCFPVGSTPLQASLQPEGLSWAGIEAAQRMPLLWVIDSAPFWLGLFASFAGRREDELVGAMDALNEANRRLEKANAELVRTSQLKSQFLANMSHELRTPLNAIIGFSRILIRKTEGMLPDRLATNVKRIHESGEHLLALVNDILDIERIEAGMMTTKPHEVNVSELVREAIATLTPAALDKGLALRSKAPASNVFMTSDPVRLRQVVDNLINNAIKYSDKGQIEVEIEVRPERAPDQVLLVVRDEGIGIPKDALPVIFDAFRQVDGSTTRAQGGVGLGLHLVNRIVGLLGGTVAAESEVGVGSTFTVSFPDALLVREGEPTPSLDPSPMGEGPVLLVIDDSPETIELTRTELVEAGFRVHVALSGEEGLAKARAIKPQAILLDIIMPGMDGWAVLKELRRTPELSHIPVVITSLLDETGPARGLGIDAWLTKPISPERFREVLGSIDFGDEGDVLVVEDDRATSDLILQQLGELSIGARAALDGRQALAAIDDRLPRAMILDIMLPEVDGFGVLEELRKRPGGREVAVVVYTALDLDGVQRKRLNGGPIEILDKHSAGSVDRVVSKVKQVLGEGRSKEGAA